MTVGRGEFEVYIAVTSVQRGERGFPIDKYILGGGDICRSRVSFTGSNRIRVPTPSYIFP